MYTAHRGMGPAQPPAPGSRLAELLEQVRAEFDAQAGRSNEHEHQRKSFRRAMYRILASSSGGSVCT